MRLSYASNKPVAEIARDLDISDAILYIDGGRSIRHKDKTRHATLEEEVKAKRLVSGLIDNGIVFCSVKGSHIHPRNFNRDLASICEKAGIKAISLNVTRHTFASTAIARGADCKTVSEILGHKDIATTLNNYVHPSKDKMKEVAEMMTTASFKLTKTYHWLKDN